MQHIDKQSSSLKRSSWVAPLHALIPGLTREPEGLGVLNQIRHIFYYSNKRNRHLSPVSGSLSVEPSLPDSYRDLLIQGGELPQSWIFHTYIYTCGQIVAASDGDGFANRRLSSAGKGRGWRTVAKILMR
jgi:hypothetical protein